MSTDDTLGILGVIVRCATAEAHNGSRRALPRALWKVWGQRVDLRWDSALTRRLDTEWSASERNPQAAEDLPGSRARNLWIIPFDARDPDSCILDGSLRDRGSSPRPPVSSSHDFPPPEAALRHVSSPSEVSPCA